MKIKDFILMETKMAKSATNTWVVSWPMMAPRPVKSKGMLKHSTPFFCSNSFHHPNPIQLT